MSAIPLADWRPVARGGAVRVHSQPADAQPYPLPAHVGLWLDRLYGGDERSGEDQDKPARQALYEAAIRSLCPGAQPPAVLAYRPFYARWRDGLAAEPGTHTLTCELRATSRILLHPGSNQSVTDGSILLHHTYGVPYLPGSALKGLARCATERRLGREKAGGLFGPDKDVSPKAADAQGYMDFLDALWIPEPPRSPGVPADWSPLALDIVNPHHREYYTGGGERPPPADYDLPVPTHRLTLSPGTRFLFAVQWASDPDAGDALRPLVSWLLEEVLGPALEEEGIGAWTSAGYGRLAMESETGSSSGRAANSTPAWQQAQLSRNASTGELMAALADGRRATVRGQEAATMLAGLPPEMQTRIRGGKLASLMAQVEAVGRRLQIKGLRLKDG